MGVDESGQHCHAGAQFYPLVSSGDITANGYDLTFVDPYLGVLELPVHEGPSH